MKINNNTSFPYPVLGIGNDITPGLPSDAIDIKEQETPSGVHDYAFKISLKFDNPTIQELVTAGKAEFTCEVDCAKTFYNYCFRSKIPEIYITIPRRSVYGRINFRTFITAITEIKNYNNPGKSDDFKGFVFNLEPGEILAAFPLIKIDTDLRSDILHVAGTFMEIRKDENATETTYRIDSPKIGIVLPTNLYNIYQSKIGEQNIQIVHASLVFNALVYALYNLDDFREKDLLWVRCILARFSEEEQFGPYREQIDKKDIPNIAQALLGNPYERLFDFLNTTNRQSEG